MDDAQRLTQQAGELGEAEQMAREWGRQDWDDVDPDLDRVELMRWRTEAVNLSRLELERRYAICATGWHRDGVQLAKLRLELRRLLRLINPVHPAIAVAIDFQRWRTAVRETWRTPGNYPAIAEALKDG